MCPAGMRFLAPCGKMKTMTKTNGTSDPLVTFIK